jgi:hypothetical protein
VQYDSISRFAARYDEIRINNLHTNSTDQKFINIKIKKLKNNLIFFTNFKNFLKLKIKNFHKISKLKNFIRFQKISKC